MLCVPSTDRPRSVNGCGQCLCKTDTPHCGIIPHCPVIAQCYTNSAHATPIKQGVVMSWNKSGDERAKSYQVYKDLQREHQELRRAYDVLTEKLRAKDETLMRLSLELYEALHSTSPSQVTVVNEPTKPHVEHTGPGVAYVRTPSASGVPAKLGTTDLSMRELLGPPKRNEG